jgi:EmrB/QacA subfamily drug resistance transporter
LDIAQIQQRKYKFFMVGAIGTFMATLDGSIVNVALPSIARTFNAGVDLVAWVVLAYSLTLMSLMIVFGAWTQRRGYLFAYRFAFILFVVGSTLCALSTTIHLLIISRIVQAAGTAMFAANGPGLVTTVFPPEERGKGIGLIVMMVSAGFMVGPPLGGYILTLWGWHGIFLINIPIGIFGLFMTNRYFGILEPSSPKRKIPLPAAVSVSLGLICLVYALNHLDDYGLGDFRFWGLVGIGAVSLTFFAWRESRPQEALIGLKFFDNRPYVLSIGAQMSYFGAFAGVLLLIPFYLEHIRGLEPNQVGLYLVVIPIVMFIFAPLSGRLSDRIGFRLLTSLGMVVLAFSLWLLSQLHPGSSSWYVILCLATAGAGSGLFSTPNSSAMMGAVTNEQRPVASSILGTTRNLGMSTGVALATALFAHFQRAYAGTGTEAQIFLAAYRPVLYVAMGLIAVGLTLCLVRVNRYPEATAPPAP